MSFVWFSHTLITYEGKFQAALVGTYAEQDNASSANDVKSDKVLVFRSYTAAAKHIKSITGKSDRITMQKCCSNNILYQNR